MSNESRRRQVLASLVPVKPLRAPNDFAQTDYEAPSVLALQRNQTPEGIARTHSLEQLEDNSAGRQEAVKTLDTRIHEAQQRWLAHQQERFDAQVERSFGLRTPRDQSVSAGECGKFRVLQQLDHIEQLLHTAGESLWTSHEASDCLVATQCYSMALEQLTAMIRTLKDETR